MLLHSRAQSSLFSSLRLNGTAVQRHSYFWEVFDRTRSLSWIGNQGTSAPLHLHLPHFSRVPAHNDCAGRVCQQQQQQQNSIRLCARFFILTPHCDTSTPRLALYLHRKHEIHNYPFHHRTRRERPGLPTITRRRRPACARHGSSDHGSNQAVRPLRPQDSHTNSLRH